MFVLDTNVVSELRRPDRANVRVWTWATSLPVANTFLSAITLLELELGVLQIERRDELQGKLLRSWLDLQVKRQYEGRVLPVDSEVAVRCARMHVPDPRCERDALIAATALTHGLAVATRNVGDFANLGVRIINPWLD